MHCCKVLRRASSAGGRILGEVKRTGSLICVCCNHSVSIVPQICIVGSGPAGFGVAQTLLKNHNSLLVDMYEKYPIPFGLIRYGVSPDHQDVKNATNGYARTAQSPRFSFFGNVDVSKDVSLSDLRRAYHAVILCHGAQEEVTVDLPGKDSKNVLTSKQFVGWYNGLPDYQDIEVDLSGKTAAIIGVGNVALDCARMLLKPVDQLKDTDITDRSLSALASSNIRHVHLLGRRGPLQMACTRKELSEVADLPDTSTVIEGEHFTPTVREALNIKDLSKRKHQRLVKYLEKVAAQSGSKSSKNKLFVRFLRSPIEILTRNGKANGLVSVKREMKGEDAFNPAFVDTSSTERLDCDLIISCIGYGNAPLDQSVPFEKGRILQKQGRVSDLPGVYACGWCSHGAKGVLADSGSDSLMAGASVLEDIGKVNDQKPGSSRIIAGLREKGKQITDWKDWQRIDDFEVASGESAGKVREKIDDFSKMLDIVRSRDPDKLPKTA